MSCNRHCSCSCNEINKNLGSYIYNALLRVQLPAGHPSLMESLHKAFTCGLPSGHISIIDIIKTKL